MAIDFETMLFLPCQDTFSREIVVTPIVSQPAGAAYTARGIYNTRDVMIQTDVGMAIISDQQTILDILEGEFPTPPQQGDQINIPAYQGLPAKGDFEVTDVSSNGVGQLTLAIRKLVTAAP